MNNRAVQFQAIHDTYRPKILRYLTHLVGQPAADDLTQDVLVKISDGLQHFRGDSSLSTWIYRIATNTARDSWRSSGFRQTRASDCALGTTDDDLDSGRADRHVEEQSPSVEAIVIREEMNQCVREFVHRLPENYRAVMVLSELEGFKNSEIGEILGVSLDTVKIRLHRAREKLRQDLSTGCSFHRDERNEFACDRKS
jgi:RNA polymerase sigma-70 factor (ECF subfamily)